jgi:recombination associated protein RdgC
VLSMLRQTLETLPAKPATPQRPPAAILTGWLLEGGAPPDFVPADACELRDREDSGSVIRCKGQNLGSEEILNHLRVGMEVVKLAVDWDERLSFVLADDLSLKRLKVGDGLLDELDDGDDPAARLDAEFALMALQVRELIARLDAVFGLVENTAPAG